MRGRLQLYRSNSYVFLYHVYIDVVIHIHQAYSEEPNNKKVCPLSHIPPYLSSYACLQRKADEDKSKESALKRGKVEKK